MHTRFLQRSFSFYRVLTVHEKIVALEVLEKDIKGSKRREKD